MKYLLVLFAASCAGASSLNMPEGHPLVNWRPAGPGDGKLSSSSTVFAGILTTS
jgi:hypothetical protein